MKLGSKSNIQLASTLQRSERVKVQLHMAEVSKGYFEQSLHSAELLELGRLFFELLPTLEKVIVNNKTSSFKDAFLRNLTFKKDPQLLDRMCAEILLCRNVDNFQSFLADLLTFILQERPEMLRSKKQVSIEEVLRCSLV